MGDNGFVNSVPSPFPSEEYKQRLQARELRVAQFDKIDKRIGNVRLMLVVATLVAAWWSFERGAFSAWWLLIAVGLFVAIAGYHAGVERRRLCAIRAVEFYRRFGFMSLVSQPRTLLLPLATAQRVLIRHPGAIF